MVLAPSWYMLEVYDRVVNSRNIFTLTMLTLLVVFIYLMMEFIEWVRKKILYVSALELAKTLEQPFFEVVFAAKLKSPSFSADQAFSDFKQVKQTLHSVAFMGLMDLPFALIFLFAVFYIHPTLGLLTLLGLAIQAVMTFSNQYRVNPLLKEANQYAVEAQRYFLSISRRADAIQSMGMFSALAKRWSGSQHGFLVKQAEASELAAKNAASSKLWQTLQSSLILGLAAYLSMNGKLENGGAMMIIASIIAARALAPFVQLVMQWKSLGQAKESYDRLVRLFDNYQTQVDRMSLPPPKGDLSVEQLSYVFPTYASSFQGGTPNGQAPAVRNVSFNLEAGQTLVVTGPSASGKTTLSRLLCGILAPSSGYVRLNGADIYDWDKKSLGQYIGYMAQSVELMDGTIAENITRFGDVDIAKLNAVIELLSLSEILKQLPDGLETMVGTDGLHLSGGQRQRIALARAAYGAPKLIVLDEPNANLDLEGEVALQNMISTLKQQGTTFIVISHLQNILNLADLLMVMVQGQVARFGRPADVISSLQAPQSEASAT